MLDLQNINYWAVLVVWVLYMAIGAWWYSKAGFAKQWTKYTGVDILKIPEKDAARIIRFVALSALIQAFSLAAIFDSIGVTRIVDGLGIGLVLWLGFVAATTVGVTLYSKKSWAFLWLNSSYFLVVMVIGSIILSSWR